MSSCHDVLLRMQVYRILLLTLCSYCATDIGLIDYWTLALLGAVCRADNFPGRAFARHLISSRSKDSYALIAMLLGRIG